MTFLPFNRKTLFLALTVLLIIALPIFILLVQRTQENRSRATAATTLSLTVSSPDQIISVNDPIVITLTANPGSTNLLSVISFSITYDKTKVAPTATPFTLNPTLSGWKAVTPVQVNSTTGTITGTYSIGSDPTLALQRSAIFGTLAFTAIAGTEGQMTSIGFSTSTAAYSLGSTDTSSENVLSTTTPAQFTIASSVLPTSIPSPTGQVCLEVITFAVNDTTGACAEYSSSCIPAGWHTVNSCPTITATPSSVPSSYTISGGLINETGGPFSSPVTVKVEAQRGGTHEVQSISGNFTFNNLPADEYMVSVILPAGYTKEDLNNNFSVTVGPNCTVLQPPGRTAQCTPEGNVTGISFTLVPINSAFLSLNLGLHGIGYAGDNASPGHQVSFSPTSLAPTGVDDPKPPMHLTRQASVQFYDEQNQLIYSIPATVQFSPDTYAFGNMLPLSTEALTALGGKTVSVRVSIPKYLTTIFPLITIKANGTTTLPYTPMITANVYSDATNVNQLDILDYNAIMDCREDVDAVNKAGTCSVDADVNDDGIVNVFDYQLFIRELSIQNGR